jgi:beta-1,4-mannosyltransferase
VKCGARSPRGGAGIAPLRVLHSMRWAADGTRYATHMAATAGDGIEPLFFSWRRALAGRYDLFHLHWPEGLTGSGSGTKDAITYVLTRLLLLRLRLMRIPVVRTLHNHAPHDRPASRRLKSLQRGFERLTRVEIHLVPEPGRQTQAVVMSIPHGSYIEPFAAHPRHRAIAGRVLCFGLIRPYKGIEELLDAFARVRTADASLLIVGESRDRRLAGAIERAAAGDARIVWRNGFVPDRELVAAVSSAQLVVLPYRSLHSSGAVLVALSLARPVLVPDTVTTRALREEVGPGWVHLYSGPFTAEVVEAAIEETRQRPPVAPDLHMREWRRVRVAHHDAYRRALQRGL